VRAGVQLARTLLSNRLTEGAVHVLNMSDVHQKIRRGTCLGTSELVRPTDILNTTTQRYNRQPSEPSETADTGSGEPTFNANGDEPMSFANRTDSGTDSKPLSLDFSRWNAVELRKAQYDDPNLRLCIDKLQISCDRPSWECVAAGSTATKAYWAQWKSLILYDGVLYRTYVDTASHVKYYQLIPPKRMQRHLNRLAHTGITGGHLGPRKILDQTRRRFYWCGWRADVHRYYRQCAPCAHYHRGNLPR